MSFTIDYTPYNAIATLAKKAGRNEGARENAQLRLQQADSRRADEALALRKQAMADQMRQEEIERSINIDRYNQALERQDEATAENIRRYELERQTDEQRYVDEPERQMQKAMQQAELLKKNEQYVYDESQKREKDTIQRSISWVRQQVADGTWNAAQGKEAEEKLWRKFHSILPSLKYDDTPVTSDIYEKYKVQLPDGSVLLHDPKTGKFYDDPVAVRKTKEKIEAEKRKQVELEAKQKEREARAKMYVELSKVGVGVGETKLSKAEKMAIINEAFGDESEVKDKFTVGQKITKNGKVYTYIGNGQWSY